MTGEYSIIMHSTKILLFQNSEAWMKKDSHEGSDVPVGCCDGGKSLTCRFFYSQPTRATNRQNWHRFISEWWS